MQKRNLIILLSSLATIILFYFIDGIVMQLISPLNLNPAWGWPFGKIAISILLVGITIFFWKTDRKRLLAPLWACPGVAYIFSVLLKLLIERPRLFIERAYIPGVPNFSFPSSHATVIFAILAVIYEQHDTRMKKIWIIYLILVLINRVIMKQHYLSDLAGGALLGFGVSLAIIHLMKKNHLM